MCSFKDSLVPGNHDNAGGMCNVRHDRKILSISNISILSENRNDILYLLQFECDNREPLNNATSSVTAAGVSGMNGCISTPWVRLFSRYMVCVLCLNLLFARALHLHTFACALTFTSLSANDGDLLVGDSHKLPLFESPLRSKTRDRYWDNDLLRVERLGISVEYISGIVRIDRLSCI